jgi:hypothetical protein
MGYEIGEGGGMVSLQPQHDPARQKHDHLMHYLPVTEQPFLYHEFHFVMKTRMAGQYGKG